MNDREKHNIIMLGGLLVTTAAMLIGLNHLIKKEEKKRKEIKENSERNLTAIYHSGNLITSRIRDGYYEGKSFKQVEIDFEFEIIAYLNK